MTIFLLSATSCHRPSPWCYREITCHYPEGKLSCLSFEPEDRCFGIKLDFFAQSNAEIIAMAGVMSHHIPASKNDPFAAEFMVVVDETIYCFLAKKREGDGCIVLPESATHLICRSLLENKQVTVAIANHRSDLPTSELFTKFFRSN